MIVPATHFFTVYQALKTDSNSSDDQSVYCFAACGDADSVCASQQLLVSIWLRTFSYSKGGLVALQLCPAADSSALLSRCTLQSILNREGLHYSLIPVESYEEIRSHLETLKDAQVSLHAAQAARQRLFASGAMLSKMLPLSESACALMAARLLQEPRRAQHPH